MIGPIGDRDGPAGSEGRRIYEQALIRFEEVVRSACEAHGIQTQRADTIAAAGEITDQILRHLFTAEMVIADLTDQNPNVMYELGLRHATGLPTFQISERQSLSFDVRQIRTIFFPPSEAGRIRARDELSEQLGTLLGGEPVELPAFRAFARYATIASEAASAEPDDTDPGEVTVPNANLAAGVEVQADAPGFLEVLAEMEQAQPELTETLNAVATSANAIQAEVAEATEQLSKVQTSAQKLAITNRLANRLGPIVDDFGDQVVRMEAKQAAIDPGMDFLLSRIEAGDESVEDESIREFLESVSQLGATSTETIKSSQGWLEALRGSLGASRQMDVVMRRLISYVERQIPVFELSMRWGERARRLLG